VKGKSMGGKPPKIAWVYHY